MKKRIDFLGINPWVYDFAYYDLWAKPLGLLYILGGLKNRGYKVALIDCVSEGRIKNKKYGCGKIQRKKLPSPLPFVPRQYSCYGIDEKIFIEKLKTYIPRFILLATCMTYWYPGYKRTIEIIRKIYPEVPIIIGGPYIVLLKNHLSSLIKSSDNIYYVQEDTLYDTLKKLSSIINSKIEREDLYPLFEVYKNIYYGCIQTSYGCPFRCKYCASKHLHKEFYQKPPEKVIEEIEYLVSLGISDIAFYDDALLVKKEEHFLIIMDKLISKDIHKKVRFHTPNGLHLRYIDKITALIMKKANFKTLRLSFEGVQSQIQEDSSLKVNTELFIKGVNYLKEAGYQNPELETYILVGLPRQKPEEVFESISFLKRIGVKVKIADYSPVPGTYYYEEIRQNYPNIEEPLYQNNTVYTWYISPFRNYKQEITKRIS